MMRFLTLLLCLSTASAAAIAQTQPELPSALPAGTTPALPPDQPGTPPTTAPSAVARSGVPNLVERLEALRPSNPLAYFELGEEVAYEMPYKEGQALARTLFVLAFELDRAAGGRTGVSRSACLSLADLATRNSERRWLLAMASMEPGQGRATPPDAGETAGVDDAPFEMAVAIGWYRSEEYRRARETFAREEAPLVLRRVGIDKDRAERFVQNIREIVTRGVACDRCRNERVIRRTGEGGRPTLELCPVCHGNPGPKLTEEQFVETLRTEATLLGCRPASWAAATLLSVGQPLRDAEPDELAAWFAINPRASMWKSAPADPADPERAWMNGTWIEQDQPSATQPAAASVSSS